LADLVETYVNAWNHDDPDQRRHLLAPIWAGDASYTDPRTTNSGLTISGLDALLAHISATRAARTTPQRLIRTSDVTIHDHPHPGPFHFTWEIRSDDDRDHCITEGVVLGERDADGRLSRMHHGPVAHHPDPGA
jgi:hypothetical protein